MTDTQQPIAVYNRYSNQVEGEEVYGERWLRWVYEHPVGRVTLAAIVKRRWFSRWYGWRMSRPASAARVRPFVERYRVDAGEFLDPIETYRSFNEFFCRRLKPTARPIAPDPATVVFPADGRHLGFADLAATDRFYAKGQSFDVAALVGDAALARRFDRGTIVISRLCPVDYHRFHFPCAGSASEPRLISGHLYSVNPIALRRNLRYLAENKRMVTLMDDTAVGLVCMVEIGATCVGSIVQTAEAGPVAKGAEKGFFRFGGSCIVTLFEPRRVELALDLRRESAAGRELYAHMGDTLGKAAATGQNGIGT